MKFLTLSVLVFSLSGFVRADVLRLRNGIEFSGHYIGGTKSEIWFQRDGMVPTTEVIPTSLVEGLKFEPGVGNPAASVPASPVPRPQTWFSYLRTVLATAWFPYVSSTRTVSVTSAGGPIGRVTR
jgi:hypothetical protein